MIVTDVCDIEFTDVCENEIVLIVVVSPKNPFPNPLKHVQLFIASKTGFLILLFSKDEDGETWKVLEMAIDDQTVNQSSDVAAIHWGDLKHENSTSAGLHKA